MWSLRGQMNFEPLAQKTRIFRLPFLVKQSRSSLKHNKTRGGNFARNSDKRSAASSQLITFVTPPLRYATATEIFFPSRLFLRSRSITRKSDGFFSFEPTLRPGKFDVSWTRAKVLIVWLMTRPVGVCKASDDKSVNANARKNNAAKSGKNLINVGDLKAFRALSRVLYVETLRQTHEWKISNNILYFWLMEAYFFHVPRKTKSYSFVCVCLLDLSSAPRQLKKKKKIWSIFALASLEKYSWFTSV